MADTNQHSRQPSAEQPPTVAAPDSDNMDEDDTEQDEFYVQEEISAIDFYKFMRIPKQCHPDRIRAAFHKLSTKWHPNYYQPVRSGNKTPVEKQLQVAEKKFEQLGLIYSVLKDAELRRIYDSLGYDGVHQSEQYAEYPIFDVDPYQVFEDFWNGVDEKDREYLLLHGPDGQSDEEEAHEENEEAVSEDEEVDTAIVAEVAKSEPEKKNTHITFEDAPMPRPPASVLVSSSVYTGPSKKKQFDQDVWKSLVPIQSDAKSRFADDSDEEEHDVMDEN